MNTLHPSEPHFAGEDDDRTPLKVLISAYACGPKWGSEVGMGWNWVVALSNYCQLTIVTEFGFKAEIESIMDSLNLRHRPKFYFIDVGYKARQYFWKQGDWRFYRYYKKWQKEAYTHAKRLTSKERFHVIHQLNMIGFREPGYLWRLGLPSVWGPIGGHAQMPWRYMLLSGLKPAVYYSLRNILNVIQMRTSRRVSKAMEKFDLLIAATKNDERAIRKLHKRIVTVITETGTTISNFERKACKPRADNEPVRLVWSGILQARKALPILLHALAQLPGGVSTRLDIVGDGERRKKWQSLAANLGIDNICTWHGRVPHSDALNIMRHSDVFAFTSLLEATSTVVIEALSLGLPVICHDTCGFGTLINNSCGIKVPVVSPSYSIKAFRGAIVRLFNDRVFLNELSLNALSMRRAITWDQKAFQVANMYRDIVK